LRSGTANINIDEAVLIEQCRGGDFAAMERLIIRYQNRIYNVILKMCANPDDAEELTQETFVKILEGIEGFNGRSSFYTWAFRIAVNLTINHCKRDRKLVTRSIDAEDNQCGEQAKTQLREFLRDDSVPEPAVAAQNRELCEIVVNSLSKLDDTQRAVIILRDIEDMSYAQIADVLDIELGTVKSRLSRGRSSLREILEAVSQ
jgi:RNA polymerase sigma-70 factor (ECF subfamily)